MYHQATSPSASIGNTPLLQLTRIGCEHQSTILCKQESRNPMGSVKDRIALAMILDGMERGLIRPETTIIEPTSGNTGLGLAAICAEKGLKLILTMPESMSVERRQLLAHLGAELILTPAGTGMKGAIAAAEELLAAHKDSFMPAQFNNPANPETHRRTTAQEIWSAVDGKIDIFVAGVGTGGTITGVGETLKQRRPSLEVVAVEPADSPVLSGGAAGPHKIQGIGAGFVPAILNTTIIDRIITVTNDAAMDTARQLAIQEGILCGPSSGAAVWACLQLAAQPANQDKTIVTVLPDTGERYLSTDLLSPA
ncbi:MAG: cysteine synthase A [Desulfobulbaceae bacterium]|uniref:cysteine synthase n=1 Tax=Candidatus Desulfatifera sulfidica TaxID=2841691 RepID=A0A8J6N9E8_9BACT|nr:cysteine synthase A [Candidatus Desulfatifera sulfidica]